MNSETVKAILKKHIDPHLTNIVDNDSEYNVAFWLASMSIIENGARTMQSIKELAETAFNDYMFCDLSTKPIDYAAIEKELNACT